MIQSFVSDSAEKTAQLAASLAHTFVTGSVVFLEGELGAGKTAFVKGFAAAIGIAPDTVLSPTFMLMRSYEGERRLVHCDLYRLESEDEAYEAGVIDALTAGDSVCFVEWADAVRDTVTADFVVRITVNEDLTRTVTVEEIE